MPHVKVLTTSVVLVYVLSQIQVLQAPPGAEVCRAGSDCAFPANCRPMSGRLGIKPVVLLSRHLSKLSCSKGEVSMHPWTRGIPMPVTTGIMGVISS